MPAPISRSKKVVVDEKLVLEIKERLERGETPKQIAIDIGSRRSPRGRVARTIVEDIRARLERGEKAPW